MALTATPQSAFPHERAWGEVIVPTLRKRLEDESHALAKRMSAASIASSEDQPRSLDSFHTHTNIIYLSSSDKSSPPNILPPKPSAIPRPSLQHSRAETPSSTTGSAATPPSPAPTPAGRSSRSGSFKRSRTLSQPFPFDIPSASTSPPPPPLPHYQSYHLPQSFTRSDSPMTPQTIKGTRIPVSRARASSTSSNQFSFNAAASGANTSSQGRTESRNPNPSKLSNGYSASPGAVIDSELWPLPEVNQTSSIGSKSTTTMRTPRSAVSELVNEQAPFNPNSASSRNGLYHQSIVNQANDSYDVPDYYHQQYTSPSRPPRLSSDSDERPFEHWYRGDVSRNGGVGELRVAKRQEMLDIANYGHTLRQASARLDFATQGALTHSRSRSNSRGRETGLGIFGADGRPRSGSLGANDDVVGYGTGRGRKGGRESFYLDDEEYVGVREGEMVLDERPLTDLDTDEEVGDLDDAEEEDEYDDDGGEGDGELDVDVDGEYEGSPSPPPNHSHSYQHSQSQSGHRSDTPSSSAHGTPTTALSGFKTRIPTPTSRHTPPNRSSSSETSRSHTNATPNSSSTTQPPRTPTPSSTKPKSPSSPSNNRTRKSTNASTTSAGTTRTNGNGKRAKSPAASSTKTNASSGTTNRVNNPGKNRTRSPASSSSGTGAKGKKPPVKKVVPKNNRDEEKRGSVAQYPGIGGTEGEGGEDGEEGDMAHAIPSWTQPVGKGPWDDVVLPVVARKKGLEGYEQANGQSRPKPANTEMTYEPAPGTFGFDNTRRRPPRTNLDPEEIPMDEFGARKPSLEEPEPPQPQQALQPPPEEAIEPPSPLRSLNTRAESPAPFSHYVNASNVGEKVGQNVMSVNGALERMQDQRLEGAEEGDGGAGCCKCVVM